MDLVQVDDPSSSIPIYISPQIEELLGYPRDAWLNDDELWLDVLHPDDRERMVKADERARATLSRAVRRVPHDRPRRAHRVGQREGRGRHRPDERHRCTGRA